MKGTCITRIAALVSVLSLIFSCGDSTQDTTDASDNTPDASHPQDAASAEDAAEPSSAPRVSALCAAACSKRASAECEDFDEDGCNRQCHSLGLYLVYYLDCFAEFNAARECEAAVVHSCPADVDPSECEAELSAEQQCAMEL